MHNSVLQVAQMSTKFSPLSLIKDEVKREESAQKITVPDQLEESHWSQQQEQQLGTYQDSPQQCPMSFNYAKDGILVLQNINVHLSLVIAIIRCIINS